MRPCALKDVLSAHPAGTTGDNPRGRDGLVHTTAARSATIDDATLLADWLLAFHREAVPLDSVPFREDRERAAGEDRFLFGSTSAGRSRWQGS
jgi:hypothetical protein